MCATVLRRVALIGCLGLAWVTGGCPAKEQVKPDKQAKPYTSPELEYRGIEFKPEGFTGMDVGFRFELVSRDERAARVLACPYTLELEGLEPVKGTTSPAGELGGQGTVEVETTVAVPWPEGKQAIQAFLARKSLPYKFLQDCNLEAPGGAVTVSGSDSGSIPLPRLPELTVSGANAERFTGTDIRLNFELSFVNENRFKIEVEKIDYKITVEGKLMAEGTLPVVESIPPSNEAAYDISSGTLSGEQSKEIQELIKKPSLEYHLEGAVVVGGFVIPVDATGTISFPH